MIKTLTLEAGAKMIDSIFLVKFSQTYEIASELMDVLLVLWNSSDSVFRVRKNKFRTFPSEVFHFRNVIRLKMFPPFYSRVKLKSSGVNSAVLPKFKMLR